MAAPELLRCDLCGVQILEPSLHGLGKCDTYAEELAVSLNGKGPTIRASDVIPEKVEWLWDGYVPLGMTTVLGGFPGVGKSTILYDLAARVSRDGLPVLVVTAEDHLAAVARPRLEAAKADLELVRFVTAPITLPDDAQLLEELVKEFDAKLIVLDPLMAFLGNGVNTHKDHHVRRVLAPLGAMAEKARVALVVVLHTNKATGTEPLMRISGSIGFTGAARIVLLAADDPQDDGRRILAVAKSNLAEVPAPLAYRVTGEVVGEDIQTSRIDWLGAAPEVDVRELLSQRDPEERTTREEAIEYLRESGVQTAAYPAAALVKSANSMGIGEKTLQRARRSLGVKAWKDGFKGPWYWGPRPNEAPITLGSDAEVDTLSLSTLSKSSNSLRPGEIRSTSSEVDRETLYKGLSTSPPSGQLTEADAIALLEHELGATEVLP